MAFVYDLQCGNDHEINKQTKKNLNVLFVFLFLLLFFFQLHVSVYNIVDKFQ